MLEVLGLFSDSPGILVNKTEVYGFGCVFGA